MEQNIFLSRHSVRQFTDEKISEEQLMEILTFARRAPSAKNGQPWIVSLLLGDSLQALREDIKEGMNRGELAPQKGKKNSEPVHNRAKELFGDLKPLLEKQGWGSTTIFSKSMAFFDAPAVVLIGINKTDAPEGLLDCGIYMGYLMLAAQSMGVASVAVGYPRIAESRIVKHAGWSEDTQFVCAIALGIEDKSAAVNEIKSNRQGLHEIILRR